jgi:hypothetical protein
MTITQLNIGGIPGTGGAGLVGVPDLVDVTRDEAEAALTSIGLRSRVQEVETLGEAGKVYDQSPRPPRTVRKGFEVRLFVIKSPVTPPDLGAKLDDIKAATDQIAAVKTATDEIAAVRTATDQIAAVRTATDQIAAIRTATDQIAAIKTATDQVAAIKAATDQIAALETDAAAASRQQALSDTLTDVLAKLQEIEDKIDGLGGPQQAQPRGPAGKRT